MRFFRVQIGTVILACGVAAACSGGGSGGTASAPSVAAGPWNATAAADPCTLLTTSQIAAATGSSSVQAGSSGGFAGTCSWLVSVTSGQPVVPALRVWSPSDVDTFKAAVGLRVLKKPADLKDGLYTNLTGQLGEADVLIHGGGFQLNGSGPLAGNWVTVLTQLANEVSPKL